MRLAGKVGFISGGTSGIGLATAAAFVREGARIAITGSDHKRLAAAKEQLGGQVLGFAVDVSEDAGMAEALSETARTFGGLDVVFANAGFYRDAPLGSGTREAFLAVFETNVIGVFMTVQGALPHLREGASIIITSSVYATMGPPGASAYAASKGAVSAMARVMASELAPRGIRVNVVVPGAVETPSWGFGALDADAREELTRRIGERALIDRMLTADEVANTVVFLASDGSTGVNAAEFVVDGGTTGAIAGSPRYRREED